MQNSLDINKLAINGEEVVLEKEIFLQNNFLIHMNRF